MPCLSPSNLCLTISPRLNLGEAVVFGATLFEIVLDTGSLRPAFEQPTAINIIAESNTIKICLLMIEMSSPTLTKASRTTNPCVLRPKKLFTPNNPEAPVIHSVYILLYQNIKCLSMPGGQKSPIKDPQSVRSKASNEDRG